MKLIEIINYWYNDLAELIYILLVGSKPNKKKVNGIKPYSIQKPIKIEIYKENL